MNTLIFAQTKFDDTLARRESEHGGLDVPSIQ